MIRSNVVEISTNKNLDHFQVIEALEKSRKIWLDELVRNEKRLIEFSRDSEAGRRAILAEIKLLDELRVQEIEAILKTEPTFRTDEIGNCIYASEEWSENFGWTLEQVRGFDWANTIHPKDAPTMIAEYLESLKAREPYVGEYRIRTSSGKYKAALTVSRPVEMAGIYAGTMGITVPV